MSKKHFLEFTVLESNTRFCIDVQSIKLIEDCSTYTILYFEGTKIIIKEIYKEVIDKIIKLNEL
jgi:uncharacterized protein YlzI (FlbEa/FlbD family)